MHANDVFSFFKNYFWYQHIKAIQNVQTILNFSKKKKILIFWEHSHSYNRVPKRSLIAKLLYPWVQNISILKRQLPFLHWLRFSLDMHHPFVVINQIVTLREILFFFFFFVCTWSCSDYMNTMTFFIIYFYFYHQIWAFISLIKLKFWNLRFELYG
jgi:hypothetical protein